VIVGGGFGGVAAARALRKSGAEVFLIDRRTHHIFQPLLYQVATAVLSPSEVAAPIRQLARKQKNLSVMLAEVTDLDLKSRSVTIRSDGIGTRIVPFDYLILAPGMQASYFGHDEFAEYAPSLKTLADGDPRIRFAGPYARHEIRRVHSEIDVLVAPSVWYENTPFVMLEAQAAKIPIVASRLGGLAEIVEDGRSGLLFEAGNPGELAEVLARFRADPSLWSRLRAGIPPVKRMPEHIRELLALYEEVRSRPSANHASGDESRDEYEEKVATLARLNHDLCEQIAFLSDLSMTTDTEKRRLDRRYLVVRPVALMKKVLFLYRKRRERIRLERGLNGGR
jgi:hypothetical protein